MKYIGIDVGSSFLKAVLLDLENDRITDSRSFPSPKKSRGKIPYYLRYRLCRLVIVSNS